MDDYSKKVQDPPARKSSSKQALMPNEGRWIGASAGQLNWLARQYRADLMCGVSRVQQLAGSRRSFSVIRAPNLGGTSATVEQTCVSENPL